MIKSTIKEALLIIFVAGTLGLLVNTVRHQSLDLTSVGQTSNNAAGFKMMSIERAAAEHRAGTALFADARLAVDYEAGHIAGAVNLPEPRFEDWIGPFLEKTDPQTKIITYCDGAHCPLAEDLAEKLSMVGFENVYYLTDGWGNWRVRDLPIEKGS